MSHDESMLTGLLSLPGYAISIEIASSNIYFVEYLRARFGDPDTTLMLEGLELACRFRSLFLEHSSEFSSYAGALARPEALKDFAAGVDSHLNLLRRDALQAGLNQPSVWLGLIDPQIIASSSRAWLPERPVYPGMKSRRIPKL